MDVLSLTQALIRFQSVTPRDDGCLDYLQTLLKGVKSRIYTCEGVSTLHAIVGEGERRLCFAGHVDVVPVGSQWTYPPFDGVIDQGRLYGRGAVDMKGAIAAFVCALLRDGPHPYEIHLVLTSDEEGPALYGTRHVMQYLPTFNFILVGEPTNPQNLGEMIKIGRRGSLHGTLSVNGRGGHIAYPGVAHSPIPEFLQAMQKLLTFPLQSCSSLQVSSLSTDTQTSNMIPSQVSAKFNIRFSNAYEASWLIKELRSYLVPYDIEFSLSAEPFLSGIEPYHEVLKSIIFDKTGRLPTWSTSGGTSDARFLKDLGPIAEFGLISNQAHKADEHVNIQDLMTLCDIYQEFLKRF